MAGEAALKSGETAFGSDAESVFYFTFADTKT